MKTETIDFLKCVALSQDGKVSGEKQRVCQGTLAQQDDLTLVCERCNAEYPLHEGIPLVLPASAPQSMYLDEELIQQYYEAHFGPYLTLPQTSKGHPGRAFLQGFDQARSEREASVPETAGFYRAIADLFSNQSLSEEFFQYMLDLSRELINPETLAADVGCGLGRMTFELAKLGAKLVIGLDLSPRMLVEAARLASQNGAKSVRLNTAPRRGIRATLSLTPARGEFDFVGGDATTLPLRSQHFDFLCSLNTLDRVAEPRKLVDEAARVLKLGGHLLISDPYEWEEKHTSDRDKWAVDMKTLFPSHVWRVLREVDGVPFLFRIGERKINLYMSHALVYQKVGEI